MARKRMTRRNQVSLFPFLDILACVIGNLILIITTVVLEQMDSRPVAAAARIDEVREEAKAEAARARALEQELAALKSRAGAAAEEADAIRRRIAAAEERLREAERRVKAAATKPAAAVDASDLARIDEERKRLEAEAAALERQIAERRKAPAQTIAILPAGSGRGPKRGVFVEAAKDRLVVHEKGGAWEVPAGKIAADERFKKLLATMKGDADAIVTFLVRSDGLATLAAGQKAAQAAGVRHGRVPLPGDGAVDFSATR